MHEPYICMSDLRLDKLNSMSVQGGARKLVVHHVDFIGET